jgi:predicted PurR-regulated permease PerM
LEFRIVCIYHNTAHDETITKILQGLTTLSNELTENSGINDPFADLTEKWFGRWKAWMTSILTSLIVVAGVLILSGCYIIPCVQGLIQRLRQPSRNNHPPPYQNNVFLLETQEHKSQQLLNEFEENNLN